MKLQTVWQTLAVILAGYIMSGCIESNYRIDYPSNGGRYVGTQNEAAPIVDGSTEALKSEFTISYESAPSAIFKILLNGHDVSAYFVLGASSATGDIEKFKQFFRQGKNTLAVNPLGLGPNVIFNLDTAGPTLVVTRGEVSYLDHATETVPVYDSNGNVIGTEAKKISDTVEIEGFLRDPSDVSNVLELDLLQITGYDVDGKVLRSLARATVNITVNPDGSFCACGADSIDINGLSVSEDVDTQAIEKRSLLYSFRAKDVYGYQSSKEYLADNEEEDTLAIDNAVRIAVGDTFVNSLRPMIAASIHKSLADAPIDIHDVAWDDNKVCADKRGTLPGMDMTQAEVDAENEKVAENSEYIPKTPQACTAGDDGSVLPAGLNPVKTPLLGLTFDTFVRQVYMHDGSSKSVGNATLDGRKATVLLNNFKVNGDDQIDIDMVITEILVDLDIKGKIWIIPLDIPMSMYIQRIIVDTGAKVQASNKKVSVQLQNSNFDLQGIQLGKSELCVGALCIPITGLGNLLMPLIEGLIGDLLPSIMNPILEENLKKIVIGGTVTQPQNQTSFDMLLNVANLGTGNLLGPNNPFDMLVGLESVADVLVSDASVKPALGPVFTDDPVDPSLIYNALGDAGTNLTVAVSSNLINQSLAAMYAVGTSHLTIYNGKTYYGADEMTPKDPDNAGQTLAKKGETRIRLWPDMPPALSFSEEVGSGGEGRAAITYESATLSLDTLKDVAGELKWQSTLALQVNFELAVAIHEKDGAFTLGSGGPPIFTINKMVNNTPFQVPTVVVQALLDVALLYGGDLLADKFVVVDLGTITENALNGTVVKYLSDADDYTINLATNADACISFDDDGAIELPLKDGVSAGGGDGYDLVCETINFVVNTNTVGVTGLKGSNLFFQMEARDKAIPAAPALPRFDLDDDGTIDYRDNCKVGQYDLAVSIDAVTGGAGLSGYIDIDGNPVAGFEDSIRANLNQKLADVYGGGTDPTSTDIDNWNGLRVADQPISLAQLGTYPWITLLYSNASQYNSDGDRLGELCEDDADFDGIYADNLPMPVDNCPSVFNPGQLDTLHPAGVGDVCNVRTTYVLLRSLKSQESGGTPLCLVKPAAGSGWVSGTMHTMSTCNDDDVNQRFYMKAVNNVDLSAGVEFYTDEARTQPGSRLAAYGEARSQGVAAANADNTSKSQELRLVNDYDSRIKNENDDWNSCGWGAFACTRTWDRADPIWWPRQAASSNSIDEVKHPWYIDTKFNFHFVGGNNNLGVSCMTYAAGWGVDLDSQGETGYCAVGNNWRWAIWVGGADAPWNGEW